MGRPRHPLYTIGYSGHSIDTFIATLQAQNISLLIDVRMTPISRKKGFSKNALRQALEGSGIQYQHIRLLGSPRELRNSLNADKDYESFFASYRAYLERQEPSVKAAVDLVSTERACLMCVEQQPYECHRSVVAEAIADAVSLKVTVHHLPH